MNTAADIIKSTLTMRQVAEYYGYEPNRAGFIACPFHSDKTPSIKVYNEVGKGFYCFGCGAGGSVIDFVMRIHEIDFRQAVMRLNYDFNLNISVERPTRELNELRRRQAQEAEKLEAYRTEYSAKIRLHRAFWWAMHNLIPEKPEDEPNLLFTRALLELDGLDRWFEQHPWR